MARRGGGSGADDLVRLGLFGVVGVAAWQLALNGQLGFFIQHEAMQLRQRFSGAARPGTPPAVALGPVHGPSPSPPAAGGGATPPPGPRPPSCADGGPWYPTTSADGRAFLDMGSFPVEWNGSRLRQACELGGTNEYRPGDVFQWSGDGSLYRWDGGWTLTPLGGGGSQLPIGY